MDLGFKKIRVKFSLSKHVKAKVNCERLPESRLEMIIQNHNLPNIGIIPISLFFKNPLLYN